jgi:hypothetical protein
VPNGQFFQNEAMEAFLLQLDIKKKMLPNNENQLIINKNNYGPCFGNEDLWICDQCNTVANSKTDFPYSYKYEAGKYPNKNQESYRAFAGVLKGQQFKVE